jgi:hypothetical protein
MIKHRPKHDVLALEPTLSTHFSREKQTKDELLGEQHASTIFNWQKNTAKHDWRGARTSTT